MSDPRRTVLLPIAVAAGIAVVVAGAYVVAEQERDRAIATQNALAADQAALRLEDYVRARLQVVDAVRHEWERGLFPDQRAFASRVEVVATLFGGYQAINWIDGEGRIRWVVPRQGNEAARDRSVFQHPQAGPFARAAFDAGEPQVTPPLALFQGVRGFATYFPIREAGAVVGQINGVFQIGALVEQCLGTGTLDTHLLEIVDLDGGALAYRSPGFSEAAARRATAHGVVAVMGRRWEVRLAPGDELWRALMRDSHAAMFVLGLLLALGVGWLIRLAMLRQLLREAEAAERADLERQLLQAQKMEAVGRLAGGVAHDFNNMMMAVLGHAELAGEADGLDEDTRESLAEIAQAAQRAAALASQLLAFSQQQVTAAVPLDLNAQLTELEGMLRRVIRENVALSIRRGADLWPVVLDPGQLGQVVMNLVVNAVDAMPGGGPLEVTTRNAPATRPPAADGVAEERGDWVVLAVRDEGIGMTAEVRERIFEPFFTTKPVGEGTGLGLATSFAIVARAGGALTVHSTVGEGTTFEVWLPRAHGVVAVSTPKGPVAAPDPGGHETVLLVEDEAQVREIIARSLERAGYTVWATVDAVEALAELEARPGPPDAVISDVVMPGMDGLALSRALRERGLQVPIILCSGYAEDAAGSDDLSALGVSFVAKPVAPAQLLRRLREVLDGA